MKLASPLIAILSLMFIFTGIANAADQPNILWIFQEDTSPWIGAYGSTVNKDWTPNIDKMAADGVMFKRAFVPVPVCSACRSSMMLGANAIRFGAHEHRSRRGKTPTYLPKGLKTITELMRESGYFTFNVGKTDYNFAEAGDGIYSTITAKNTQTPWRQRNNNQPFFGQIQLKGGKTNTTNWPKNKSVDPASVTVPADYPQDEIHRKIVAQHHDTIRSDDQVIGGILAKLKADNLLDSTIVVYFSDHGANNLIRHKQMPTEGGLHVPFVIIGPKKYVPNPGTVRNDLVDMIDLTATSFAWAGLPIPKWVEGRDLFAKNFKPRTFVAGAKDRLDHTIDRVRTIRTDRYRYTRNFFLDRVFLQPQYRDTKDYVITIRAAYADGSLDPKLAEIYFGERPAEELYDVIKDPAQVNNLAGNPKFAKTLKEHRAILDNWLAKGDLGAGDEPDEELVMNSANKKWRSVNSQYERIREDSDGDGLSDRWEEQNNRDPHDNKLLFTFDCGGWQTEGWAPAMDNQVTNIAGYQGYLDFDLLKTNATLIRKGLKLKTKFNTGALVIRAKASAKTNIIFAANRQEIGETTIPATADYADYRIPLNGDNWAKIIRTLQLKIAADKGTTINIDSISVAQ